MTRFRAVVGVVLISVLSASCAPSSERRLVSIREGELTAGYLQGHLLYVETRGVRESVLFKHDLWANERERIRVPDGFAGSPAWSPDGSRVAFSLTDRTGQSHIWVVNEDGSDAEQLTFGEVVDDYPRWAPNGEYLVFSSIRDGDYDWRLFIVGAIDLADRTSGDDRFRRFAGLEAGEVALIGIDGGHSIFPDWSPDGGSIIYSNRVGDRYNLRVFDVVTGDDRQLLDSGGNDMHARFAPDGSSVIYTTNFDDFLWQIWRRDSVTGEQVRVIGSDSMDEFPAYSYDAEFIAFSTGHLAIYRADAEQFPDRQLRWAVTINLAWSPDWKAP